MSRQEFLTLSPVRLTDSVQVGKGGASAGTGFDSGPVELELSSSPNILHRWNVDKFYTPAVVGFTDINLLGPPLAVPMIFELLLNTQLVYAATIDENLFPQPSPYATKEERELESVEERVTQFVLAADLFSPIPIESIPRLQARMRGIVTEPLVTGGIGGSIHPILSLGYQLATSGELAVSSSPPTLSMTVDRK